MDAGRTNPLRARLWDGPHAGPDRVRELDGLRAVAVLPVIAMHFGAAVNGGAGVTVFFALSGYIITTLLLAEHDRSGSIDLGAFYVRRFRRLLPAATLVVIATVIAGRTLGKPSISRDAIASLTYWANFARYTSAYSYGQTAYAPLEHFWSLAIEEQFYVVLPVLALVMLRLGRRHLTLVATLGLVASAMFAHVNRDDPQMYFHSLARVGELLIGVVLAVVLPSLIARRGEVGRQATSIAGHLGLLVLVAVFARVITPEPIVVALVACLVIAGRPRILGAGPLVLIGAYSYGLYLWHPFAELVADPILVRLAILFAVTVLSFHLIEFPVRRHLPTGRALTAMATLSAIAFVVVAFPQAHNEIRFLEPAPVVAAGADPTLAPATTRPAATTPQTTATVPVATDMPVTVPHRPSTTAPATATTAPATITPATITTTTVATSTTTPPPPPALRISAAGDSTQMFADAAWQAFAAAYPDIVTWVKPPDDIVSWTSGADGWGGQQAADLGLALASDGPQGGLDRQGCPMVYDLPLRAVDIFEFADSARLHSATPISSCDWHLWMPAALAEMNLDVLIVSWSVTDMWEYQLPNGRHVAVGDPEFDALLDERRSEFEAMAAEHGTRVLWTTYQPISKNDPPDRWATPETSDLQAAVLLQRPCVSDLRTVVRADPTFAWYQDGYHFTPEGAARAVASIVPDVVACASGAGSSGGSSGG